MKSDQEIQAGIGEMPDDSAPPEPIPYASGRGRARFAIGWFGIGIQLSLGLLVCDYQEYQWMGRIRRGEDIVHQNLDLTLLWKLYLNFFMPIWFVAAAAAFLMWTHRAHRNLPALGATGLKFSPRGAVGLYFVPFLNIFMPYQAMREIYNASDPGDFTNPGLEWRSRNAPFIVRAWWGLFLIMNLVTLPVMQAGIHADSAGAFQFAAAASIVDETISIAAMLAVIWLVWSIEKRQELRAAQFGITA